MAGFSRRDRWIYSLYARWCRYRAAPFSLSEIRKRPVRLLVCLPSNPEEARKAVEIIPDLIACLEAESVSVVGEPGAVAYCDLADERISVAPLDRGARWWFGLPSPGLVDRLSGEGFNLAVDLNPCAELLPAVLCLRTGAPIRLCLDDPQRRCVFNVRVLLAGEHGEGGKDADPSEGVKDADPSTSGEDADPRIAPSPARSETPLAGIGPSSGDSPYARLLRVVQAAVRPASRPVFQLDSTPRSRDI